MVRKIVGIIIIAVLIIGGFKLYQNQSVPALSMATVMLGEVSSKVSATGYAKVDDIQFVSSKVNGLIEDVNFDIGDKVKKGDILATIDKGDIQDQIDQAKANLDVLNAEKIKLLAGPDEETIEQARINLEQAIEAKNESQKEVERSEKLYKNGALAKSELDKVMFQLTTDNNKLLIAKEQLQNLLNMPDKNDIKIIDEKIRQAELSLESARDKLEDTIVRSMCDGTIIGKTVEKGTYVQAGTSMFKIADLDSIIVQAEVEEKYILNVKNGQETLITGKNLMGKEIKGRVKKIAPSPLDTSDLSNDEVKYAVDIELEKGASSIIKVGMTVDVDIVSETKDEVLVIPVSALIEKKKEYQVFVYSDGKAILRKLKIGIKGDELVEVVEGLKSGEKVISLPPRTLLNNTEVKQAK